MSPKEKEQDLMKAKFKIGKARLENSPFSRVLILKELQRVLEAHGKDERLKLIKDLALDKILGL